MAAPTRRAYLSAQRAYLRFCQNFGSTPVPADESTLVLFVAHLAQSISFASAKLYLTAVRSLHIQLGASDPIAGKLLLERAMRGLKASKPAQRAVPKIPVTTALLGRIRPLLNLALTNDRAFWALCCIGTFGLLRSGEFLPTKHSDPPLITWSQLTQVTSESFFLEIKTSKTDPFRQGFRAPYFASGHSVCPFTAVITLWRNRTPRSQRTPDAPIFVLEDGKQPTRAWVVQRLRSVAEQLGLPRDSLSGHSFRKGGATSLAAAGVPDSVIKTMGRWQSTAYQLYVSLPMSAFRDAMLRMANSKVVFGGTSKLSSFNPQQFSELNEVSP